MPTDILELPPVAHIVAELDDYETQEFSIDQLAAESWVSPTKPSPARRRSWADHTIAALISLAFAGG